MTPAGDMRWWGWGDPGVETEPPARVGELLASRNLLPPDSASRSVPPLEAITLGPPREMPEAVVRAAGEAGVDTGVEARIRHSGGHALADLLERRAGLFPRVPDGVVRIEAIEQLEGVLRACSDSGVAVVPWGGGTSVTGGLRIPVEEERPVLSLDTGGLRKVEVDVRSMTATLGAGLRGPEVEGALAKSGVTLGHFPQSFEYATVGGFAATRSAGQASGGYGRFDEIVLAAPLVSPTGTISALTPERVAEGPSLPEIVVGSEGAFGVIPEVRVRVRPRGIARYEGWVLPGFEEGVELARRLAQEDLLPTVLRISDEPETSISLGMSAPGGLAGRVIDAYLGARGVSKGSLVIVGFEGEADAVRTSASRTRRELRALGGARLGQKAGEGWESSRFHGPYLREGLLDLGLIVETFETAAPWSEYENAWRELRTEALKALDSRGMTGEVMCHLSHCYPDGASLYFTVIALPGPGGAAPDWAAVKGQVLQRMVALGLPVSHHHGVGRDHVQALAERIGPTSVSVLQAIKDELDPAGIMNPGCLIPSPGPARRTPG